MCEVYSGRNYVVAIYNKNGSVTLKDVVCLREHTNFQEAQMEIETTDGEFYPLYDVYEDRNIAIKKIKKSIKDTIGVLKKSIHDKEMAIKKDQKRINDYQNFLDNFDIS